jgi:hypothetical protein
LGLGHLRNLKSEEIVSRYEWEQLDDLLYFDIKTLARFRKVGQRITADR